jgi:PPOX class probable F420-dependent enzyme
MAKKRRTSKLSKLGTMMVERERVCRLATVNADGMPHVVPLCHVFAGGKIYLGSADTGPKVRNIKANPRVAVVVDVYTDYWNTLKSVMVQGRAKLIERGPAFQRARRKLYDKYPHYSKEAALSPSDSVIIEITPTHVFERGF